MMHNFKIGDVVTVLNQTMGGWFFIEGTARIVRLDKGEDDYIVQFYGEPRNYPRWINPNAQKNPEEYVRGLNEPLRGETK